MKKIKTISYYLLLSIIAFIIIIIMTLDKTNTTNTNTVIEKLFIAAVFIFSCIFGISLAIYPNWWKKSKKNTDYNFNSKKSKTNRIFQGHHPNCNMFKNHIIIIKNKPRCTGCLGLIIGALASILLITLYLIIQFTLSINIYNILIIIGIIVLILVFIEISLPKRNKFLHILLNSLLIINFLTITISILEITKNLIYVAFTIILCFLWLDTRIHISKQQHHKICNSCPQNCKSY